MKFNIPGANRLADVTTEKPIAHGFAHRLWWYGFTLNIPIRDTFLCIKDFGGFKSIGRAGVETSGAGATVIRADFSAIF